VDLLGSELGMLDKNHLLTADGQLHAILRSQPSIRSSPKSQHHGWKAKRDGCPTIQRTKYRDLPRAIRKTRFTCIHEEVRFQSYLNNTIVSLHVLTRNPQVLDSTSPTQRRFLGPRVLQTRDMLFHLRPPLLRTHVPKPQRGSRFL
jgi:hypothetical protein